MKPSPPVNDGRREFFQTVAAVAGMSVLGNPGPPALTARELRRKLGPGA